MIKDIPNGVYPTMITPYTADNKIDYNAVEKLINWYDEKGVAGIYSYDIARSKTRKATRIARENGFPLRFSIEPEE